MQKSLLAAALLTLTVPALTMPMAAHADTKAVEARQGYYKLVGANMGALAEMAQGKVDYSAETAQQHADNLALLAGMNNGFLFPAGTSSTDMPGKTRAKAAIWENFPAVVEKISAFSAAMTNLKAEAGKGRGELGAALGQAGATCKSCHSEFREN